MNDPINTPLPSSSEENEIIVYQPDSTEKFEIRLEKGTVWLNSRQMSLLFDCDVKTIGKSIANVLKEELDSLTTIGIFATVQTEGNHSDMIQSATSRVILSTDMSKTGYSAKRK